MSAYLDQPTRTPEQVAHDKGRTARHIGMPVAANRFKPGTVEHAAWFEGWSEMDEEMMT